MDFNRARLTEPGVKYFMAETLKRCHEFKQAHQNTFFNVAMFFMFCGVVGCVLLYKYQGKLSPEEIAIRDNQKKQYILSKIKNYQESRRQMHQNLITGLPPWEAM